MRNAYIFSCFILLGAVGCGQIPNQFGTLVPDPENPGEVIKVPPAPIEVTESGVIIPPTAPVKTYQGGRG